MTHEHADASVRQATVADAPAIGAVQAAVFREAYAGVLAPDLVAGFRPEEFAGVWAESLADPPAPAYRLLVACAGEQVVGFAAFAPSPDPDTGSGRGELTVLGVDPGNRHAGHGSRLLNAAVDTARELGFQEVLAWVLEADEVSRDFLAAAGFRLDGARRERVVGPEAADRATEVRLAASIG